MKKEKRQCNAFVEKNNARCGNYVFGGTNYCFHHYPKKEPIALSLLLTLVTFIFSTIFSEPISNTLSKIPLVWYWVDHQKPIISEVTPNIEKYKELDKNNKLFKIMCFDRGSGVDLSKSFINIHDMNDVKRKPVAGKLNKSDRELKFVSETNLKNGKYELEAYLIDRAGNNIEQFFPFIVRENEALEVTANYSKYGESLVKEIFGSFIEERKNLLLTVGDYYVYYLKFVNKDNNVVLKNLSLDIRTRGAVVWSWKKVQHRNADGVELTLPWGQGLPRPQNQIFMDAGVLNIDKIGMDGFITIAILVDSDQLSGGVVPPTIDLWGRYFSDGYGISEIHEFEERTINVNKGDLGF